MHTDYGLDGPLPLLIKCMMGGLVAKLVVSWRFPFGLAHLSWHLPGWAQ